jgi:hypothetical protein
LKITISSGALFLSSFLFFHKKAFKKLIKHLPHVVSGVIALVSLTYLVIMVFVQTKGLEVNEYSGKNSYEINFNTCDVDASLLSSKNGYIKE